MSYFLYDIMIAAILLFFFWRGCRRGFVLTLCSLLAVFVALIGASFLSNALAEPVAKAVEPIVARSIHDTVTSYYQRSPAENTSTEEDDWLAQLPIDELLEPLKESKLFRASRMLSRRRWTTVWPTQRPMPLRPWLISWPFRLPGR